MNNECGLLAGYRHRVRKLDIADSFFVIIPTMEVIQKAGLTQMTETVQTVPDTITEIEVGEKERTAFVPQYHVVLLDDDDHSYDYVIEMLMALFGHSQETAYKMAVEVDTKGRVIVETTHKERAELKRDQIQSYGPDWRIPHCKGSMSARIEPAEEAL